NLILTPGSQSFEIWNNIPVPVYLEVYFFNWTNPADLNNPDVKLRMPKFVETGPEQQRKIVQQWNDANNTVTFLQNKTWHFDPSLSDGSLDDIITTLNAPAVAAAFSIRKYPHFMKRSLAMAMALFDTSLHVKKSVRELTFEGYEDPLLELAAILPDSLLPTAIPFDKFGWFYTRNNSATYDGVFNMYTGKGHIRNFGKMAKWNYNNESRGYQSNCNYIKGSAGDLFPPNPKKDSISIFSTDICRTITLPFKEKVFNNGLTGYRYMGDENMLDNSVENTDAGCFCSSGKCPPKGMIDVSSCKWNAPAFVSFPHFYHADPSYRRAVHGMKPNKSIHEMFLDLEEKTGIPLQVEASMQINLLLESHPEYRLLKDVPTIYFPILWFKQWARIDSSFIAQLKVIKGISAAGYILLGVFIWLGFAVQIGGYLSYNKNEKNQQFLPLSTGEHDQSTKKHDSSNL
ncbi:Protein croquemort, partial [Orchesella cincta]